jgi:hypothetical protein
MLCHVVLDIASSVFSPWLMLIGLDHTNELRKREGR